MNIAVVGHVEWCRFLKVSHLPEAGEIIKASVSWFEAAGGGGVAAVQLAKLGVHCTLFTSLGADVSGEQAIEQLQQLGVEVHASRTNEPTKGAVVYIDDAKERTITTIGSLKPSGHDSGLPWEKLSAMDAVYFVSGDEAALRASRKAPILVATSRILPVLKESAVLLDALVMSSKDKGEQYKTGDLTAQPELVVRTNGVNGGSTDSGVRYAAERVDDNDFHDTYGCGDSFAAGITFGLAKRLPVEEVLALAAHCGADAARRKGAHGLRM